MAPRLSAPLLALLLAACGSPEAAPSTAAPTLPSVVLTSVCAEVPCGGPEGLVNVYRDAAGNVAHLVRNYGSCADSPSIHFAADGTRRDVIPLEPVVPGSPEAETISARIDGWTPGLTLTDVVRCRDGVRVDPR